MNLKVYDANTSYLFILFVMILLLFGCSSTPTYQETASNYKQQLVDVSPLNVEKMEPPFNKGEPDVSVPTFYSSSKVPDGYVIITKEAAKTVRNTFEDYNFSKKYSEVCSISYDQLRDVTLSERELHLKHLDILKERSEQLDRTGQMLDDERSELKKTKLLHYVLEGGLLTLLVLAL